MVSSTEKVLVEKRGAPKTKLQHLEEEAEKDQKRGHHQNEWKASNQESMAPGGSGQL